MPKFLSIPKSLLRRARRPRPAGAQFPWEEVFDSMGDGLVVLDSDRRLIGINPEAERLIGQAAESALGYTLEEILPEKSFLETILPAFKEVRTWTLRGLAWETPQGRSVHADLSLSPLMGGEGEPAGWVLIIRDMTPVKNLEEEVRRADRLAMMGTIAAGLAHEIKNPLSGIKGAAQLIQRSATEPVTGQYLDIIIRESERVDRLISDLLMFARPKPVNRRPCNINEVLSHLLTLEEKNFAEGRITVVREFDPSLPPVLADPEQLTQVFLNFVKNSVEAMPEGGRLLIRSRMNTDFRIRDTDEKKGIRMILVEIEDTGPGMSAEDLQKIFMPFFTTKERGTGLGMAIAQRMIQEHQGVVRVLSDVGQGTTVQVYLRSVV